MKASVTCQRPAGLGSSALPVLFPAVQRPQGGVRLLSTQGGVARGSGVSGRLRPLNAYVAEQAEHGRRGERFYVLSLLAESVELNALVQRFETLAGRSAMIGFIVASIAELAVPRQGLFGAWAHFDAFAGCSALLIASSVVLAVMSKRRLGQQLQGPVLESLTAKLGSVAEGFDAKLASSLDYVFDNSLSGLANLDIDDFL